MEGEGRKDVRMFSMFIEGNGISAPSKFSPERHNL